MRRTRTITIIIILCALLCLPLAAAGAAGEGAAVSFIDDDGSEVSLDQPARRIISLYSGHTECLYYLGMGGSLIGAHSTSTFPPEAAYLPRFDYNADPEIIIAADPDLVISRPTITRRVPELIEALGKAGIPVVSLYAETLDGFDEYLRRMAALTGAGGAAETVLADFHARLDEISELTARFEPKARVFFESTETELRTVTSDSMAGMAIRMAGGVSVAGDAPPVTEGSSIAAFGAERILELADDIDVYISQRGAMNAGGDEHSISIRPGFQAVKAIREGRIYLISEKIVSSPSPRYPTGVMELARYFYPERMNGLEAYSGPEPATKRDFANIVFRAKRLSVFVPSSSKYYETDHAEHMYGLFEDVTWRDPDFDVIETCVQAGFIGYDGAMYNPDAPVTRDELARTVFVSGDFAARDARVDIADLDACANGRITQTLVDNGVFALEEGYFHPEREVTKDEIIAALGFV
ncbi:MAG: ABC transporter substrate-binding protein [Oscillospiraceae bacterium]|jgi:iron complex transport system substrate-binding protein|nr:ABC transporter substrate-binding protein [Oscillospiraceae bacterium]